MVAAAGELTCGWGPGDGVAWWGTPDLEQMWLWVGRMDGGLCSGRGHMTAETC